MLFSKETYMERRRKLRELVGSGLIVLFGNNDSPNNYPSNVYKFRQDSSFLYFFGQHRGRIAHDFDVPREKSAVKDVGGNEDPVVSCVARSLHCLQTDFERL